MECLLGISFRDFVLIAADMSNARSIMVLKDGKPANLCDLLVLFCNSLFYIRHRIFYFMTRQIICSPVT